MTNYVQTCQNQFVDARAACDDVPSLNLTLWNPIILSTKKQLLYLTV